MSGALKESAAVDIDLRDDERSPCEKKDQDEVIASRGKCVEQGVLTLATISIHPLPRDTCDTSL